MYSTEFLLGLGDKSIFIIGKISFFPQHPALLGFCHDVQILKQKLAEAMADAEHCQRHIGAFLSGGKSPTLFVYWETSACASKPGIFL